MAKTATKAKTLWACKECGHIQPKWTGSCPACLKWNTFEEEVAIEQTADRFSVESAEKAKPIRVAEVQHLPVQRFTTGFKELDRLLGGGIVAGSLTLVAGDPGIGKSTLLLQVSDALSLQGKTVLYVSGEESVEQTAMRAKRLGIKSNNLFILNDTQFSSIRAQIEQMRPSVVIVDSIQILYKQEIPSSPGSVSQVRELAMEFMHLAKRLQIAIF